MFHLIIAAACLLIIDEHTFQFRRRYLERRRLRAWQKRIRPLTLAAAQ